MGSAAKAGLAFGLMGRLKSCLLDRVFLIGRGGPGLYAAFQVSGEEAVK